jgi:hypothetical protein
VLIPIVLRSEQWRDLGRRTNPSSLAPANLTAACLSLELAEKLNNYLNIYRIDKSSEPPASAGSKVRQMRPMPSKDAAPMAQKWREENCRSILTTPLWKSGGQTGWIKKDPLSATDCMCPTQVAVRVSASRSFAAVNLRLPPNRNGRSIAPLLLRALRIRASSRGSRKRSLFRNPNRLTESVPIRILLLQTADVSIH